MQVFLFVHIWRGEVDFDQCVCVPYKLLGNLYATGVGV
jgi:hypothetical protein